MKHYSNILVLLTLIAFACPSLVSAAVTHKVKKNESIAIIAQKYHITAKELKMTNNLVGGSVKPGDILLIPIQDGSAGTSEKKAGKNSYRVQQGDTLSSAAQKAGITVASLKRLNGLTGSERLKPGRVLIVKASPKSKGKWASKYLANAGFFSEQEYDSTLAELTEPDLNKVDLSCDLELDAEKIHELKKKAYSFLGTKYRFGGETRRGIDCSSFVQQVFRDLDVDLPRTAREQYGFGEDVPPTGLQKGDLVFFRTYARFPSHVGIYLGANKMIHASSGSHKVVISSLNNPYYRARFIGAKRIASINPEFVRLDDLISGVEEESEPSGLDGDTLGFSTSQDDVAVNND